MDDEVNFLLRNEIVKKAVDFASLSLAGKKRKSGEEVVDHTIRVAEYLAEMKVMDPNTLAAAVLHHCVADGAATIADIRSEFGEDITLMIENFDTLKIVKLGYLQSDEFVENLRKMFLVLAKDLRVVIIKLADIQDNLTTLSFLDPDKQKEVALETIEIFAPLAERLGMGEMRSRMQDLAFPYLDPEGYKWVQEFTKNKLEKLGKVLIKIRADLVTVLDKRGINADVQSRVKHIYSLYSKLQRPGVNKDLNKIHDLIALRIITQSEEECYQALDIVNNLFKPLDEPISDYIAHPKPNGYQSIHIRVIGPDNTPFEIQIRSESMHEEAEYGIAAHWNYSDQKNKSGSENKLQQGFATSAEKLEWVKSLAEWQKEITNDQEFLKTIKTDFFGERIFCFTPKGDVLDLPAGATAIDFAYKIHSGMGNMVIGAKVNGKVVALETHLKNGDVVELLLSKDVQRKPNRDWLNFVVTSNAKKHIKRAHFLKP